MHLCKSLGCIVLVIITIGNSYEFSLAMFVLIINIIVFIYTIFYLVQFVIPLHCCMIQVLPHFKFILKDYGVVDSFEAESRNLVLDLVYGIYQTMHDGFGRDELIVYNILVETLHQLYWIIQEVFNYQIDDSFARIKGNLLLF